MTEYGGHITHVNSRDGFIESTIRYVWYTAEVVTVERQHLGMVNDMYPIPSLVRSEEVYISHEVSVVLSIMVAHQYHDVSVILNIYSVDELVQSVE
jgi:hypothetical protein